MEKDDRSGMEASDNAVHHDIRFVRHAIEATRGPSNNAEAGFCRRGMDEWIGQSGRGAEKARILRGDLADGVACSADLVAGARRRGGPE